MAVAAKTFSVIRSYSSAEQEGRMSIVCVQEAPIELFTAAANQWSGGIEEEVVAIDVLACSFEIRLLLDGKCFHDGQ